MVDLGLLDVLLEDPVAAQTFMRVELLGGVDATGDGPAGEDLGLVMMMRWSWGFGERERKKDEFFSFETRRLRKKEKKFFFILP